MVFPKISFSQTRAVRGEMTTFGLAEKKKFLFMTATTSSENSSRLSSFYFFIIIRNFSSKCLVSLWYLRIASAVLSLGLECLCTKSLIKHLLPCSFCYYSAFRIGRESFSFLLREIRFRWRSKSSNTSKLPEHMFWQSNTACHLRVPRINIRATHSHDRRFKVTRLL